MKRIFQYVSIILLCGALVCPVAEGRGRNDRGRNNPEHTNQHGGRPGNNGRPSEGGSRGPVNNHKPSQRPGHNDRPNAGHQRPGYNDRPNAGHQRPGHNDRANAGHQRPGHNDRPNVGHQRPGHNDRPGYRPQKPPHHNVHHGHHMPPPPPHRPWHRPTPPPSWRPPHHWRPFSTILGISFGTAINMSVSALLNSGYTVSSYGNGSVFVSNVPMLGMSWPDAILFYNNSGGLCGSRFMYPTTYYDPYRYNTAYNMLVNTYGAPVNVINNASGMEATWWGTNNQFIRLCFTSQYDSYGNSGYMTSLSFGI